MEEFLNYLQYETELMDNDTDVNYHHKKDKVDQTYHYIYIL